MGHLDQTLSHAVVDRSLPIFVLPVDIGSLLDQQLGHLDVAISTGIEEWTLLEQVLLKWIYSHINEYVAHLQTGVVVGDDGCIEDWGLREILVLVDEVGYVDARVPDELDRCVDLTFLDGLEYLFFESIAYGDRGTRH